MLVLEHETGWDDSSNVSAWANNFGSESWTTTAFEDDTQLEVEAPLEDWDGDIGDTLDGRLTITGGMLEASGSFTATICD